MIPVGILAFLIGSVLAWGYRVWILIPVTTAFFIGILIFEMTIGSSLWSATGYGFVVWLAPQLGYGFGLFTRSTLAAVRRPQKAAKRQRAQNAQQPAFEPIAGQRD